MGLWSDPGVYRDREKRSSVKNEGMKSMPDKENTTEKMLTVSESRSIRPESDVNHTEVWKRPCENLNEEIDRTMILIDSTARDLHGLMRGMFKNDPDVDVKTPDLDKVQTAVVIGRQINELMKTKLDAVKQYDQMQSGVEDE